MDKPIILIGGTAGTGKTTLAQDLCSKLQIDHRLGTGFIREIIRSQTTLQQEPSLFEYTFRANNPITHFVYQSERIYDAINACINRAKREGTSLIIEGNHLIPSLYSNLDVNLYLILSAPDLETHMKQLQGTTHVTRILNSNDVQNIRCIGDYLKSECDRFSVSYLPYPRTINDILRLIK